MSAPTRASVAGRAYLDLRKLARENHRPVDELLQLYVLEAFLDRLTSSRFTEQLVLKGGVLLAAFDERRPTRDIDLQAQALENDTETILTATCEIAAITLDDGVTFDIETATAESIRDEAIYSGVRVTMTAQLATARPHIHVDTNVGDPISTAPKNVRLPRLLGGEIILRGYPLVMVHAEKIVTAIARGTVNTRWRDFGDIHMLARHHAINGSELAHAIRQVAITASEAPPARAGPRRLRADRSAAMDGMAPPATAGGPTSGAVRRRRRGRHRLRRPSDPRFSEKSLMGPNQTHLVVKRGALPPSATLPKLSQHERF